MNENIVNFLNGYMMNPDPQYAVLLKGKWGCGKTHFINHWIDAYKGNPTTEQVLESIYVSLYGLSDTKQITTAINRVICPILYGKAAKAGKVLAKIASAMVLKHEVDLNYDGISDLSINIGIDSLSKFKSNASLVNPKKLLIFDDLERCDVPMKKLLGYLNFFVEQCNCHLIVIGDEDKIAEGENKKIFGEFKEKTIGREFEIATDIHSALDIFVNQTPKNDFVVGHQEQIEKFFAMTECDNLRILRQALWDFSRFEESMTDFLGDSRYEDIMIHVLGTYIISYCEYRGKNHQLFDAWIRYDIKGQQFDKEKIENLKLQVRAIHQRYNNIYQRLSNYKTFKMELVERVILELNMGDSIKDYVGKEYFSPEIKRHSWEQISDSFNMDNGKFILFYKELIQDISDNAIPDMRKLGFALAYIVCLDSKEIKELTTTDFIRIREALPMYLTGYTQEEDLHNLHLEYDRGVNSLVTNVSLERLVELSAKFEEEYNKKIKCAKNVMTTTLENLTDSNVAKLCDINEGALPDHSRTYNMVAIFNHVDISKLMKQLQSLSNESLNLFNHFIRSRYELNSRLGNWIHETENDIEPLRQLKSKIDIEQTKQQYMRKEAFRKISFSLEGAIKRCNGDLSAQSYD